MPQPAFYFDASTCIGCKACELACVEKNNLPSGVNWRQIYDFGGGDWKLEGEHMVPDGMFTYHVSASCMHCVNPTCVEACGDEALYKQPDGLVIIDDKKCTGCRKCEPACPYDAIHFDSHKGIATKCDFCADLLEVGEKPACVTICPQRCLDSGDFDELKEKYGELDTIAPLPDGSITKPAIVIVPHKISEQDIGDKGKILNRYEKHRGSSARVSWRWDSFFEPDVPDNPDWKSLLEGESLVLSLLAKGFHDYADRKWLQFLIDNQIFKDIPFAASQKDVLAGLSLLHNWCKSCKADITEEQFEEISIDYTHLFTISFGWAYTPPWESVYCTENQLLFQDQTLLVRNWYKQYGLEYEKKYQEPDDHIALELYFISHLADLALRQLRSSDTESFNIIINAQRRFLSEHLLRWGHHWCEKVCASARTEFLKGLGLVTRGALTELAQIMKINLPKRLIKPLAAKANRHATSNG